MSIEIKVGRHNYTITEKDRFMDNGSLVQLLTQSLEPLDWGRRGSPTLSKKLYKKLCKDHKKINVEYDGDSFRVEYFSFKV